MSVGGAGRASQQALLQRLKDTPAPDVRVGILQTAVNNGLPLREALDLARAVGLQDAQVARLKPSTVGVASYGGTNGQQATKAKPLQANSAFMTRMAALTVADTNTSGAAIVAEARRRSDPLDDIYARPSRAFAAAKEKCTERGVAFEEVTFKDERLAGDGGAYEFPGMRILPSKTSPLGRLAASLEERGLAKGLFFSPEYMDAFDAGAMFSEERGLFLHATDFKEAFAGSMGLHELTHAVVSAQRGTGTGKAPAPDLALVEKTSFNEAFGIYGGGYRTDEVTAYSRAMRHDALSARALLMRAGDAPLTEVQAKRVVRLSQRAVQNAGHALGFSGDIQKAHAAALEQLRKGGGELTTHEGSPALKFTLPDAILTLPLQVPKARRDSVTPEELRAQGEKQLVAAQQHAAAMGESCRALLDKAAVIRDLGDPASIAAVRTELLAALNASRTPANR